MSLFVISTVAPGLGSKHRWGAALALSHLDGQHGTAQLLVVGGGGTSCWMIVPQWISTGLWITQHSTKPTETCCFP